MSTLFFGLPGNDFMTARLAQLCRADKGVLETRTFPDGESYLRFGSNLSGRDIALVCTLATPNEKSLSLLFAAGAAREQGACRVGLVAPYLCYMRQDRSFQPGEAVTSRTFGALISHAFNWLVTVDPHLHRYKSLSEIYTIPARAAHAEPAVAAWIKANVKHPFLIGPDEESAQWVGLTAHDCGADFATLHKERMGDLEVRIDLNNLTIPAKSTPVLLDDIVSSGETMIEALNLVRPLTATPPLAVAIHGLFTPKTARRIEATGGRLVTTSTVPNPTNRIDVAGIIAGAVADLTGDWLEID